MITVTKRKLILSQVASHALEGGSTMLKPKDYLEVKSLMTFNDIHEMYEPLFFIWNGKKIFNADFSLNKEKQYRNNAFEMVNKGTAIINILNCCERGMVDDEVIKLMKILPLRGDPVMVDAEEYKIEMRFIYDLYLCYLKIVWGIETDNILNMDCYELISAFLDADMGDANLSVRYYLSENNTIETIYCSGCVFDALVYQIVDRIKAGKNGLNGAMICNCEQCGNEFIRYNRKKHLCDYCGSGAQRTRKYREKGRMNNAAKE